MVENNLQLECIKTDYAEMTQSVLGFLLKKVMYYT